MAEERHEGLENDNPHILVLDDDAIICRFMERLLSIMGYHVTCVRCGGDALSVLEDQPVDVLISDITMPDMSGLEVADLVHHRWPDLPIVLCTGHEDAMDPADARRLGIKACMIKPMDKSGLDALLKKVLAEKAEQCGTTSNDSENTSHE